jgi:hypothetical protein
MLESDNVSSEVEDRLTVSGCFSGRIIERGLVTSLLEISPLATDLEMDFHQNRLLIQLATNLATN